VLKGRERAWSVRSGLGEEDREIIVRARAYDSTDLVLNGVRPGEGMGVFDRLRVRKGCKEVCGFSPSRGDGKDSSRCAIRVAFGR